MFRPDSGHLQALVKIQILEITLKMQYGIAIACINDVNNWDPILLTSLR